jgi:hypothetical protein
LKGLIMAIEAAMIQYRKEFVGAFEQRVSLLKAMTTKEAVISGNQATFLVSGSGTDTAVTRGTNGLIPYGNPTNSQNTATLVEKHAPYELTGFNIFASQGDQKRVMQNASMAVINRDIDLTLLAELANATQDYPSTAQTASLQMVAGAQAILGNADIPVEDENNMFAIISPAFRGYLCRRPNLLRATTWMSSRSAVRLARCSAGWASTGLSPAALPASVPLLKSAISSIVTPSATR